jgi:hypothetical protein
MSKMLDKVSKLLAKAENAGTPEEADAFMAKAQEMAITNGIELAVARMHQAKKERVQETEERTLQVNPHNRRHNRKHFIELAMAICDVNDVEYLIGGGDRVLFMVGFPSDMDVVEALYTHLSIQMVMECDEALKKGEHKTTKRVLLTRSEEIAWEDRAWGLWSGRQWYDGNPDDDVWVSNQRDDESDEDYAKREAAAVAEARAEYEKIVASGESIYSPNSRNFEGGYRKPVPPPKFEEVPVLDEDGEPVYVEKEVSAVDGRVFRSHFYAAFVPRMKGRLWETRHAVERDKGVEKGSSSVGALAVRDKKEEVKKAGEEQRAKVHHLGTYRSSYEDDRKDDHTGRGRSAGRKSAESVPIDQGREVRH